jgi:hypothetical protein
MKLIHTIWAALSGFVLALLFGPPTFTVRTCDVAFLYRMGAGFPGDVNRTHPVSILPGLVNTTNPPRAYGELCLFDTTNGYRAIIAADQHNTTPVNAGGVLVRPYPTQQTSGGMSSAFGNGTPPTSGVQDFCRAGYIFAKGKAGMTVVKGGQVWVWATATETVNIQGELQAAAVTDKTVRVANAFYMGPADADGVVEIEIRASREA